MFFRVAFTSRRHIAQIVAPSVLCRHGSRNRLKNLQPKTHMNKFDPTTFAVDTAKPLPVILLLDVSGSMNGEKIQTLNEAVKDMLETFRDTENGETQIDVAIITFGTEVKLHAALAGAGSIQWHDLSASGGTPLGTALKMAKAMIEDKQVVPSRAYRPVVVLVSDGKPTDSWEQPLNEFSTGGRSSKCDRMSLAIGADADKSVLGKFIEGTSYPLFCAENARQLRDFFKFVSMSVTIRTRSQNPNVVSDPGGIKVQPATVATLAERREAPSAPKQSGSSESTEPSNEGYW